MILRAGRGGFASQVAVPLNGPPGGRHSDQRLIPTETSLKRSLRWTLGRELRTGVPGVKLVTWRRAVLSLTHQSVEATQVATHAWCDKM